MKKQKELSCCSDVPKPFEAYSGCTQRDSAAHAAQVMRDSGFGCAASG